MNSINCSSRIMLGFLFLVLSGVRLVASENQDASIRNKLDEFDARLKALETRQQDSGKPAQSQGSQTEAIQELRRQLDLLTAEVEKLRSGEPEMEVKEEKAKALGLGASAATIYRKRQGVSIAGYGEMTYENFDNRDQSGNRVARTSQLDFLRAILYAGYRFNDKFVFNSELEFEHATTGRSGEASVEFAYLDFLASDYLTLRGGLLLVPMGLVNEFHEPNAFLGVRRSETETRIIPSTWRENGFGVLGSAGRFQYRAYLINGLDANGFSSDGLRAGRQQGARAKASDLAFVGRLDVAAAPGILFGGSVYTGGAGQEQFRVDSRNLKVNTTIAELHAQIQVRGLDLRGLYARSALDDVRELNQARGITGNASIGEVMQGGYAQVGYNALSRFSERMMLTPYYRFERLNTQDEVPAGFAIDPARRRKFHTFGLEFRPIHQIVIKSDYQWVRNHANTGQNQFNLGLGYAF